MKLNEYKKQLLEQLENYKSYDIEEQTSVNIVIDFMKNNTIVTGKKNTRGHLTGSAFITNKSKTKVLLTHHKKLNLWVQLGGHVDDGETVFEAAYREGIEESGLQTLQFHNQEIFDIDVHMIPARKQDKEHYHHDLRYLFFADENDPIIVSDESQDVKWIPLDMIHQYTKETSLIRMVHKLQNIDKA